MPENELRLEALVEVKNSKKAAETAKIKKDTFKESLRYIGAVKRMHSMAEGKMLMKFETKEQLDKTTKAEAEEC